ncbi:MAG TPA: GNAT family N-acetyltransferase, partial [Armatimonadota bacterium]|nr:GNAT family N-acetyltransferase [Armatimonadota bacterium]
TGERVGLLWFGINRNLVTGEDEAWVFNVSVVPERQGEGVGKLLMAHAEQLARDAGFHTVGLMVSAHNERARALYKKLRFRETNLVMRKRVDGA